MSYISISKSNISISLLLKSPDIGLPASTLLNTSTLWKQGGCSQVLYCGESLVSASSRSLPAHCLGECKSVPSQSHSRNLTVRMIEALCQSRPSTVYFTSTDVAWGAVASPRALTFVMFRAPSTDGRVQSCFPTNHATVRSHHTTCASCQPLWAVAVWRQH